MSIQPVGSMWKQNMSFTPQYNSVNAVAKATAFTGTRLVNNKAQVRLRRTCRLAQGPRYEEMNR